MTGSFSTMRRAIRGLGPYQSLALLLVPLCIVEPLKLVAIAIAGGGHWIKGAVIIVAAYLGSLFVVDRLFRILKPKLMMLPWVATLWGMYLSARESIAKWFRPA